MINAVDGMELCPLGRTGILVSRIAFGAGPISTLMVGDDRDRQRQTIAHAMARGINWFDTAATYGSGASESNLGRALDELHAGAKVHVATKVRLLDDDLADVPSAIRRSVESSLTRLRLPRVTLLQLHNSITACRGDEPTSLTPADILGPGGVAETFQQLQSEGLARHLGLTGIGQPDAMAEVVRSGLFATIQTPYHLFNPSAGRVMENDFDETNYGNIIAHCATAQMGIFAIRVLAGGALAGNAPSSHTFKTPFFPLALYQRDARRAAKLQSTLPPHENLPTESLRFALAHPQIHSAIIGFASTDQIDQAIGALDASAQPLTYDELSRRQNHD